MAYDYGDILEKAKEIADKNRLGEDWRDITKELPIKEGYYLVYDNGTFISYFNIDYQQFELEDAIAWRSLPAKPTFA